ncbi:unnamed protein product, partial [Didymodactylos carnosus]
QLFVYAVHGDFESIKKLLLQSHYREVVLMRDEHDQTLLHIAIIHSFSYVYIRLLRMRDSDPCAQDQDEYTPAHYAVERDDVEMLKTLTVRFHARIKVLSDNEVNRTHKNCQRALIVRTNRGKMTAFMLACYKQAINCARYIHQTRMDHANTQDIDVDAALHYVVARNNMELTLFLIAECNADVNGDDPTRPSPLDVAMFNDFTEIKQILLANNATSRCQITRIANKPNNPQPMIDVKFESLSLDTPTAY